MNDKEKKAQDLLSAIGEIDDELLYEAQIYRRTRKRKFNYGMLAACLALVFIIAIALPLINGFGNLSEAEEKPVALTLDKVMLDCRDGDYITYSSFDELSYFGDARLVWQYDDDGEIYSLSLTGDQLASIESQMGKGESTGAQSPKIKCKIWVLDGKGNVKTPYLKDSSGNIGCQIFDYNAEIIPNESLVECISDIMN